MRASISLLLALAACTDVRSTLFLPVDADARALIAVVRRDGEPPEIFAADGPRLAELEFEDGVSLTVALYAHTLDELQIPRGPLVETPGLTRRLPPPAAIMDAQIDRLGQLSEWTEGMFPPELDDLRIAAFDIVACASARGCLTDGDVSLEANRWCDFACEGPGEIRRPLAPSFTCPPSWTTEPLDEMSYCHPPALPELRDCLGATAQFYGDTGCMPIGSTCPQGQYAETIPPGAPVIWLDETSSIDAELSGLPSGAVVMLARGRYRQQFNLFEEITIAGACTEETVIELPHEGAVVVGARAKLFDLTVEGADTGVAVTQTATVELTNVLIQRTANAGIAFFDGGGTARVQHSVVRDGGTFGVTFGPGSHFIAYDLVIEGSRYAGLNGEGPASVDIESAIIRRTFELDGIHVQGTAFDLRRARVEESANAGIGLYGVTPQPFTLSDVRIAGSGLNGLVIDAGTATAARMWFEGNGATAGNHGRLNLIDTLIEGSGVQAIGGSTVSLSRVAMLSPFGAGIYATERGTRVSANDLLITGLTGPPHDTIAAVQAIEDSLVRLTRTWIANNAGVGVLVEGTPNYPHAVVDTQDLTIIDSEELAILAAEDTQFLGEIVRIELARGDGITGDGRGQLSLHELTVSGPGRAHGTAVSLLKDARLSLSRFRLAEVERGVYSVPGAPDGLASVFSANSGLIEQSHIGADIGSDDLELWPLLTGVLYRENDLALVSEK